MLEEERNKWRGYIQKIGMIGLIMLLMLPNMLINSVSKVFADEADYDILVVDETITIVAYLGNDTDVNIPEQIMGKDVTAIADMAFTAKILDSVMIPGTVKTIGNAAFMGCQLESLILNEGLIDIGMMAFAGSRMDNVNIPSTVKTIEAGAFSQGNLSTLTLHEGLETIGDQAFWLNELTSVIIPEGVTTIGEKAFIDNKLEEVTLPGTITSMGSKAFLGGDEGKNNIHTLILQEGLSSIGESAFKDNLLETVQIPGSLLEIENAAFMGNMIQSVILNEGTEVIGEQAFEQNQLEEVVIPNTVTHIASRAFFNNQIHRLTLPDSVEEVGAGAFGFNPLTEVKVYNDAVVFDLSSGIPPFFPDPSGPPIESITLFGRSGSTTEAFTLTLPPGSGYIFQLLEDDEPYVCGENTDFECVVNDDDTVTITGYDDNATKNVVIPDTIDEKTVVAIGDRAFAYKGLTSVTIPDSVIDIGEMAFWYNQLTNVTLPNSVTSIKDGTFQANQLTSVVIPSFVVNIGERAFHDNQLTSVTIPNSVETIGYGAFWVNKLTEITIPDSVKFIGGSAFNVNELTSVTIPESVKNIRERSFGKNPLTKVQFEGAVPIFGADPFTAPLYDKNFVGWYTDENYEHAWDNTVPGPMTIYGKWKKDCGENTDFECVVNDDDTVTITGYTGTSKNVLIPGMIDEKTVVAIGDEAFFSHHLTEIELPNSLISIGDMAFYGNAITSVTIPSGLISIGVGAFANNELKEVSIPDSVREIGENAFHTNSIREVIIPSGIDTDTVGFNVFENNPIRIMHIRGTSSVFEYERFIPDYDLYSNFKGWYTDENFNDEWDNIVTAPMTIYGKWEYTVSFDSGGGTIVESQNIHENGTITMPAAPSKEGDIFAGWYVNEELTTLWDFDHGVTADMTLYAKWIPYVCGYGTDFECLDNSDGTITITGYTGTSKDVVIPETIDKKAVTVIAQSAFAEKDLESVIIPNAVTSIGIYAFHKNKLETVHIPGGVETIGMHTFSENELESVLLSEGLKTIGTNAFYNNNLQDVTIPDTVKTIGHGAFLSNEIDELTLGENLQTIADFAFGNNQLQTVTIPQSVTSIGHGAFIYNNLGEFTILGTTTSIDRNIFSQGTLPNPEELTIRSYCGSTANEFANLLGHSFEQLEANECLTITLNPSETGLTNEDVTVTIDVVNGEASEVELKWAIGDKALAYFRDGDGDNVTDSQFMVSENGTYTVYAKDKTGNERVDKITIANIDKSLLIIHMQMTDGRTMTIHAYGSDSIQQLKQKIQDEEGIEPSNQRVSFAGTVLEEGRTLADYDIPSGAILQLGVLSSDASLKQLGVELKDERVFELDLTQFDHDIGNTKQETMEIFATANDDKASITLNGNSFDQKQSLQLDEGENEFTMIVTAENGHQQTYTIKVNRQAKVPSSGGGSGVYISSNDLSLDRLEVIVDGENKLLFDPSQFNYELGDTEAETVELIAKTHDPKAKVMLDGEVLTDKKALLLNEGKNILNIVIVAENGDEQAYTIAVNRLQKVPFIDIAGHWAEGYIKKSYWGKMFNGYPDNTFRPDDRISRMEVTSVLVRLLELDEQRQVPFIDVQSIGKETMEELEKAYANGVVKGYPDQTFKPYADVTRAHLALILYRTYEKVNGTAYKPKQLEYFTDIGGYDQETQYAIAMLIELKIAEGYDWNFVPNEQATRAEAAKMLVKFKEVLGRLENK